MTDKDEQSGKSDAGSDTPPANAEKPKTVTELLNEWDATGKPPNDAKTGTEVSAKDLISRLSAVEQRQADEAIAKELSNVVTVLTSELDIDVDDFVVKSWFTEQADKDSRLIDLYEHRDTRQREWNAAIDALKPEFQEWAKGKFSKGKAPTGDRKIKAAVRAAKESVSDTGIDDDIDFGSLSDAEFALKKAEIFRMAKAGQLSS